MYHVIAIERLYASGGNEIGKRLADALGYKLYDRNILTESAKNLQIPAIYIESLEETSSGGFIFNLTKSTPFGGGPSEKDLPMADKLFAEEKNIIEKAANEGGCIIVGRAASYILKDRDDCLKVFIHADTETRMKRAIEKEGIKQSEVENTMKKYDKRRKDFYNSVTKWEWGNPNYFDMCLNSGNLGIELCTKLLIEAVSASK